MKKLFIFDLDGTLLDTVPDILYHVNNLFDMFSYPRVTYEQVKQNIQDLSDANLYIPMKENVESLNVGVACSILLYELEK